MSGHIYVTGDTHQSVDIHKLSATAFQKQKLLDWCDYVIICGDFGCIWDGGNQDRHWLDWHGSKHYTTLFIDGNHENHPLLNAYPVTSWLGGKVHMIRPNVIHLMRGQVYNIAGKSIFTIGGASSHDIEYRIPGRSWWYEEMPSADEYDEALSNLDRVGWQVDYVVTHCAPDSIQNQLADWYQHDKLTNFLETVKQDLTFDKWFFGHYHYDCSPLAFNKKFYCLYNTIQKEI